jgi:hypothetical protein
MHRSAAVFNFYKSRPPPAARPSSSILSQSSLDRSHRLMPSIPLHSDPEYAPSSASPQLKTLTTASLMPETSVFRPSFKSLEFCDGGHSSKPLHIGQDTSMSKALLSLLVAPSRRSSSMITTMQAPPLNQILASKQHQQTRRTTSSAFPHPASANKSFFFVGSAGILRKCRIA